MQPNFNEMSELERRLAACVPADDGLNADAAMFAAGRASAHRGPAAFLWPVAFTAVALLTVAVASMWLNEHQERIALASQLRQMLAVTTPTIAPKPEAASEDYERSSGSLLLVHRALDEGRDPLPAEPEVFVDTSGPSPEPDILRADSLNQMLDP